MHQTFNDMFRHKYSLMSSLSLRAALASVLTLFAPSVFANDAVILLNQMNDALHTLEYQGNLIYLKDGEVSNLSIRHTLENGAEKEVIASLDEGGDEYIKESNAFSLSGMPKITTAMQQVYSFDLGGMGKVAGRPCRIVLARPKDRKRYLQKYCIDLDRSVLLKYSLINQYHKPVERFMFTDFEVISSQNGVAEETLEERSALEASVVIDETVKSKERSVSLAKQMPMNKMTNALAPAIPLSDDNNELLALSDSSEHKETNVENNLEGSYHNNLSGSDSSGYDNYSEWFFDPLPKGFSIVSADKVTNSHGEDEQIIISDGLSSVSVFISLDNKNVEKRIRPIQSGALNILSKVYQGHTVTLVGEVPESTLHDIFKGIKRATITK